MTANNLEPSSAIPPMEMPGGVKPDKPADVKPTPDAEPKPEKGKPGRKKGGKNRPKMPDAGESEFRHGNEKPAPSLKRPDAAVRAQCQRLDDLIAAAKEADPEHCGHWRSTDVLFQRTGARVARSAWRPLVAAPVRGIEWLMGVRNPNPVPPRVTDEEIDEAASHWEAASVHLGFGEAGAAFLGAAAGTVATVGTAIFRGVGKLWDTWGKSAPPSDSEITP